MKKVTLLTILFCFSVVSIFAMVVADPCCIGTRGNVDSDPADEVNISDLTFFVSYLFDGGPQPACPDEADVNADTQIDISDLTYLVDYLFGGGPGMLPCSDNSADSVILPLTIGNWWLTDVTEYNQSGQVIAQYEGSGNVIGDTLFEGWTWYKMETDTTGADTSLWTNKEDGAWSWTDSSGSPEALVLKYPASPGDSYPLYDVTVTVESIDATITVPAGTFSCYYYRMHVPFYGTVGKIWAAPNIGIVRAEEYGLSLFSTYLSKVVELKDYGLVVQ